MADYPRLLYHYLKKDKATFVSRTAGLTKMRLNCESCNDITASKFNIARFRDFFRFSTKKSANFSKSNRERIFDQHHSFHGLVCLVGHLFPHRASVEVIIVVSQQRFSERHHSLDCAFVFVRRRDPASRCFIATFLSAVLSPNGRLCSIPSTLPLPSSVYPPIDRSIECIELWC